MLRSLRAGLSEPRSLGLPGKLPEMLATRAIQSRRRWVGRPIFRGILRTSVRETACARELWPGAPGAVIAGGSKAKSCLVSRVTIPYDRPGEMALIRLRPDVGGPRNAEFDPRTPVASQQYQMPLGIRSFAGQVIRWPMAQDEVLAIVSATDRTSGEPHARL